MKISLTKPIPQKVKDIRDLIIYAISGSLVFTGTLAAKFHLTPLAYAEWCGIIIFLSKVVAKAFGVTEDEAVKNAVKANEVVADIVKSNEAKKDG